MKKIRKFKKNQEEFESQKPVAKSRKKKRLRPEPMGRKKLLRHYYEEE